MLPASSRRTAAARAAMALVVLAAPLGLAVSRAADERSDAATAGAQAVEPDTRGLQSDALLSAIDRILKRAAAEREAAKTLPNRDKFLFEPVFTETRQDREKSVRALLDGALSIVTDAPVLKFQEDIARQREKIAANRDRIASLRERRLDAPQGGVLPGILTETKDSIDGAIAALQDDIKERESDILRVKQEIGKALDVAGIPLSQDQLDLLLDSVLGGDLLRLMTAYEVAKIADRKLAALVVQSNDDLKAARRYFAMHAALFALLVQAQELLIEKIDKVYMARLDGIIGDIARTGAKTRDLMESATRDDQRRTLEANAKAQELSRKVSGFYRDYLATQRRLLWQTREKTLFDLNVADNTYETVEASFQLKALMDEAKTSFDSLQKLDAPGFEQIFRNENLRREFETLTRKLSPAS
ncbi:hypothetical protein [Rhodomicrobium udaipurense]|uniref:Uncharacterized protein n=1 Tax=Rhodomicrobium udaipurense TaxID=1202716 RepID=A0A8I1KKT5_9HYPH|nr:hypothetical protein [Rhodomicrobium udaipurense]MBJ7544571.1 hypothetical protein [Rhodomicrobium udaipurense]